MINSIARWAFAASLVIPSAAFSSVCAGSENTTSDTTLLFINGILNNAQATTNSAGALVSTLSANGFDTSKVNVQCYRNGTEGAYDDVIELRVQAAISSKARSNDTTNTDAGYYARLGAAYQGLINKNITCANFLQYTDNALASVAKFGTAKYEEQYGGDACVRVISGTKALANSLRKYSTVGNVLAVAHSQGNFLLEAAYALLLTEGYANTSRIQAVGIAAISQRPINGRYITISQDNAIYTLQTLNTSVIKDLNYAPAIPNSIACAQNLPCTADIGKGQNPRLLATVTGSAQIPYDIASKIAAYGYQIPEDKRALLHELVEVYLNDKIKDTNSDKTIPATIVGLISNAYETLLEKNCGSISSPLVVNQQGPSYSVTAGQATRFTATPVPKNGYPFGAYRWKTSEGTETLSSIEQANITFNTPGSASVTVTPVLQDGTVCTLSAATSSVMVVASTTQTVLVDDFNGTSLDLTKWNINGPVSASNGFAQFDARGSINTKNKVSFTGSQIIIEARMAGTGSSRDTAIILVDQDNPSNIVVAHDTNYCNWGMAFSGGGLFELTNGNYECGGSSKVVHVGSSTNQFMEYRLTVRGTDVLFERGPTLANINESMTAKLTTSMAEKAVYLMLGTGGPGYSPGTFDWVRVSTVPSSSLPTSSCSATVTAVPFKEDFSTTLDPLKWSATANGGTVRSGGGSITLSTTGSTAQFPFVATTADVIPSTGNFSIFCRAKYDPTNPYGAGACVATTNLVDASNHAIYDGYLGVWGGANSVYTWGFDSDRVQLYYVPLGSGIKDYHDYETCVINGEVTAYIDGVQVAKKTVPVEKLRPRRVWLGHPGSAAAPNSWVTVETSKIEVRQLQ